MQQYDMVNGMNNQKQVENLPNEIWKPIEGFPRYQVSNMGRVKSYCYNRQHGNIMKLGMSENGYCCVKLHSQIHFKVHRLVAKTFICNPDNKPDINHKNGIKTDNKMENLEWCTQSENQNHAYRTGLQTPMDSNQCRFAVLNWMHVNNIRKQYNTTPITQDALSRLYKISRPNISYIVANKSWHDPNYIRTRFGRRA